MSLRFSSFLETNKVTCQSDRCWEKCETPGSETKDFITHGKASSMLAFIPLGTVPRGLEEGVVLPAL